MASTSNEADDAPSKSSPTLPCAGDPSCPNELPHIVERRCKHCGTIVRGGHEERRVHRNSCAAAARNSVNSKCPVKSSADDDVAAAGATAANNIVQGQSSATAATSSAVAVVVDPSTMTHKEQLEYLASVVCRFCGKAHHDASDCLQKMPSAYRERLRCNAKDQSRRKVPLSQRKCVTPDVDAFDKKMERLCQKIVPPVDASRSQWVRCSSCGKKLLSSSLRDHMALSCVVLMVLDRLVALRNLIGGGDRRGGEGASTPPLTLSDPPAILATLPANVRDHEQVALLVGIINAVVPVSDLLASGGTTIASVRECIDVIEERVDAWASSFRHADAGDRSASRLSAGESPSRLLAISEILHAPPLLGSQSPTKQHKKHHTAAAAGSGGKKTFSKETRQMAHSLNSGDIVSLEDERERCKFEKTRSQASSRASSRCGSASASRTSNCSPTARRTDSSFPGGKPPTRPTTTTTLPPLVPSKSSSDGKPLVHEPPLD